MFHSEVLMIGIVMISVILVALLIWGAIRKLLHGGGCCGEHEPPTAKIRTADRDLSHYPYRYTAEIDGMVCGNCVRRVENAFHGQGCLAQIDLAAKSAKIASKRKLSRQETANWLDEIGFTLIELKEETIHEPE
jgi:hypothetical protein